MSEQRQIERTDYETVEVTETMYKCPMCGYEHEEDNTVQIEIADSFDVLCAPCARSVFGVETEGKTGNIFIDTVQEHSATDLFFMAIGFSLPFAVTVGVGNIVIELAKAIPVASSKIATDPQTSTEIANQITQILPVMILVVVLFSVILTVARNPPPP